MIKNNQRHKKNPLKFLLSTTVKTLATAVATNTILATAAVSAVSLFSLSTANAAQLLSPSDQIIGGQLSDGQFNVGTDGLLLGSNNWPENELPEELINGAIGGENEKYLNFGEFNTGIIVTPTGATGGLGSIVSSIEFWVANDAEARDPASYEFYGTNNSIGGVSSYSIGDFSLISSGSLSLPSQRDTVTDTTGFSQIVNFANNVAYTSYMLVFPTVKNSSLANSMQLSEVQFYGTVVSETPAATPEPSLVISLIALSGLMLGGTRKSRS
ncbi:MAG: hypothetical protein F6K23_16110 [Okeania sp. SIO2C9]|uniref:hypothetical protein n=1 Tax=Okeania sp. SIO2C9 TaxID=2607791 RepID=UPI0013C0A186|nr:hypothetical protein [Okeania sp. SIO2C9]NEQ74420.1 hypothetical protein [Okeania sp. SIO2C9]